MSHNFNKIDLGKGQNGDSKGVLSDFQGGMQGHERRSTLHVLLLQLGIRIKYFFLSWFYLKPIIYSELSAYPSILRPKNIPQVDWPTLFCIKVLWYIGGTLRTYKVLLYLLVKVRIMHLLGWFHGLLMERIINKMKESNIDWEKARRIPIPEYDWKNGSPDEFYNTFGKRPHPVILRGFLKGTDLMKKYTFDQMVERFGEETVILTKPEKDGYMGKMKEVLNPKVYLHNSEILFNKYPEILEALETHKLEPYLRKKSSYAQLFVGRQGTGAPLHNAGTWNFFYMIDGTKTWYFIDPYDFYFAYPLWVPGHGAAIFLNLYPDQFRKDLYPAFQYCPYYVADLEPGDVLLNPPWWGHGIRNTSDKSVAVATRWYVDGVVGTNLKTMEDDYEVCRFAVFNFFMGLKSFRFLHDILYEPSPRYDEHVTLREKHGRFIDAQRKMSQGELEIEGYRPYF